MSDIAIHGARPAGLRAAQFRRAARHTLLVRVLRWAVPLAGGVLAAGFVLWLIYAPRLGDISIDPGRVAVSGSTITMESPRLTGFSGDRKPYLVTAERAEQDIVQPNLVELTGLAARLNMEGEGWAELSAGSGRFDSGAQTLSLQQAVNVTSNTGYSARLSSAEIDMEEGDIVSDEPVEVTLEGGVLTAERLAIADGGEVYLFEGKVRMTLWPKAAGKPADPAAPETPAAAPQETAP